jgi:hypothetical protein
MPKRSATERLLARVTDQPRAAAIYGDLLELAQTRGPLWFWTAYTRTLVSLGWRTPAAIVAAIVFTKYLRRNIAVLLAPHGNFHPLQRGQFGELHSLFIVFCWTVSLSVLFCTFIVFPYVAIRFGLRNRLTYLAGVLFLLAIPIYSFIPWVFELTGLLIALIIVAALASPLWRWPMIFLAANYPIGRLVFYVCINDPLGIFHPHHHLYPMSLFGMRIDDPVAIAVTILVGPTLYRWLLQPRSTKVVHA